MSVRLFYNVSNNILITHLQKHDLRESTYFRMGTEQAREQYSEWYQGITVKMK